jgi:KaiC/GvpD/RAD55 family RecA-like ATPase/class 3 adenylate cyclase
LDSTINSRPQIPGISEFIDGTISAGLLLLTGPSGAGKTMYCRQFLADGLLNGDYCLLVSSSLTEKQCRDLFSKIDPRLVKNLKFVNPCAHTSSRADVVRKLSAVLKDVRAAMDKVDDTKGKSIRIVVDSLTHLLLFCDEKPLLKFATDLSMILKDKPAMGICTLAVSEQRLYSMLSAVAEGILEMKLEDNNGALDRSIRLFSIKGLHHEPTWIKFRIADNAELFFEGRTSTVVLNCTLCGKTITGTPFTESDFVFDTKACMETYGKLAEAYGSSMSSETGLPLEVFNVSFFFIDIVGLSDPSLSVKKQIQKIEALNKLIASCDAFKASSGKRIILPTGDGMAIGFLLNPELPMELSIQLHRQLRAYNKGKPEEDRIRVRIGLGSGPVFAVTDMNNIQNVWGPGIILARRVMDAGDDGHILLADKLAEELIALKDKYRSIIKPICQVYEIKHGQKITLYSAYSHDFGNPELPARVPHIK